MHVDQLCKGMSIFEDACETFLFFLPVGVCIDASGISYLSEVVARSLLNLGKKHLDHQNWEN